MSHVLHALFFFIVFQSHSWAQVNYAAFTGKYQLIAEDPNGICEMNWTMPLEFKSSTEEHWIKAIFDNDQYFYMEYINDGRIPFDTCSMDGTIGYAETLGRETTLENTTVYLNPGDNCEGTTVASSHTEKWELKEDLFILTFGETNSSKITVCKFRKISK